MFGLFGKKKSGEVLAGVTALELPKPRFVYGENGNVARIDVPSFIGFEREFKTDPFGLSFYHTVASYSSGESIPLSLATSDAMRELEFRSELTYDLKFGGGGDIETLDYIQDDDGVQ